MPVDLRNSGKVPVMSVCLTHRVSVSETGTSDEHTVRSLQEKRRWIYVWVSAALAASPSSCQPLSHGSHRRPRPSQHLNSIMLLQHFLINICTSFLMPFHDSKRAARNPSACLTHYSGIFHYTAMIFHRCRTRDLMRGCHANSLPMNLQTNSPSASRRQIMLEINLVQLLPDRAEGLAVSRRTRWNVPPVYPAFSYCKPLPMNGFLLWTTKLNIVHCVYVFRLLSSSLWSVETARFL